MLREQLLKVNLESINRQTRKTVSDHVQRTRISTLLLNESQVSDNSKEFHNYDINYLNVPLNLLKNGENTISIYSEYSGHALEINWPGPVIMLIYGDKKQGKIN